MNEHKEDKSNLKKAQTKATIIVRDEVLPLKDVKKEKSSQPAMKCIKKQRTKRWSKIVTNFEIALVL